MGVADLVNELIQSGNGFVVDQRGNLYRYEPAVDDEPFAASAWRSLRRDEALRHAIGLEIRKRIATGNGHCVMPSPIVDL